MSEIPNDKIGLVELFQIIGDGKWLIAGLSALIIAPAFAFLAFIYEPGKKASINLLQLSDTHMNLYSGLKSDLSATVTAGGLQIRHFMLSRNTQTAQ